MSIKPIDKLTSINKIQKMAIKSQNKISKEENTTYYKYVIRDKEINKNLKKVIDPKSKELNLVKKNKDNQRQNKKEKNTSKKKEKQLKKKNLVDRESSNIGSKIDIQI